MNDEVWPMRLLHDVENLPPRAIIFTPFLYDLPELSVAYAQACLADSMRRGESPLVPELLWGLEAELQGVVEMMGAWARGADRVAIYTDHPAYDDARARAEAVARLAGVELEERSIHGEYVSPEDDD